LVFFKQVYDDARSRECEINRRIMSRIARKRDSDAKSEVFNISCQIFFFLKISRGYSLLFGCSERSNSGNVAPKSSLSSLSINTKLHFAEERCRIYSEYDLANFRHLEEKMKSNIKTKNSAGNIDKFSSLKSFRYAVIETIFNILKQDIHFNNT
jgi:hypothetical protein